MCGSWVPTLAKLISEEPGAEIQNAAPQRPPHVFWLNLEVGLSIYSANITIALQSFPLFVRELS